MIITMDPQLPDPALIEEAVAVLRAGGVIAYPTETFYGLGADALNEKAVDRIFRIKGRNFHNPLPVIIGGPEDLKIIAESIPEKAHLFMEKFWPGPLTLIFRASPAVPPGLTAFSGKIGVRISSHPIAAALCQALDHPLIATSANPSGAKESISAQEVQETLENLVDAIINGGQTPGVVGSTILDVTIDPPLVLREGAIPLSKLNLF